MKQMDFQPQGTCSKLIHIELTDDDRVSDVSFVGGCPGNLKGISALIKGMYKGDVISRLCDIKCGNKSTSCPDQLACAVISRLCDIKCGNKSTSCPDQLACALKQMN